MKYAKDRHRPDGDWVIATQMESVAGVNFRKEQAISFAQAAMKAERKGMMYGLQLEHQPNHPKDQNAIAVFGTSETKPMFRKKHVQEWHIGYVPADLAKEMVDEFVSRSIPIAAELYSIYWSDEDYIDFNFFILAPPGNSHSSRLRRSVLD